MLENLKKTWKNKLMALFLVGAGITMLVIDRDATILAVGLIIALPLFFAKKSYFYGDGEQ